MDQATSRKRTNQQEKLKRYFENELRDLTAPVFPPSDGSYSDSIYELLCEAAGGAIFFERSGEKLAVHLVRKLYAVDRSYEVAKGKLLKFIEQGDILDYFDAVAEFEVHIADSWRFIDTLRNFPLQLNKKPINIFEYDSKKIYERINTIYNNSVKHVAAKDRLFGNHDSNLPIWLSNQGIETLDAKISYEELYDNISHLGKILGALFTRDEDKLWDD